MGILPAALESLRSGSLPKFLVKRPEIQVATSCTWSLISISYCDVCGGKTKMATEITTTITTSVTTFLECVNWDDWSVAEKVAFLKAITDQLLQELEALEQK